MRSSAATVRGRGRVRLVSPYIYWSSGNQVLTALVDVALDALAGAADSAIAQVLYGDSGSAAAPEQTGPLGTHGAAPVTHVSRDGATLTASFALDVHANAVETIRELVLVTASGTAIARVVVEPEVPKNAKVHIDGTWTLELELV